METERAFFKSALSGMGVAVAFAFVILLIATGNVILSVLAIVCVALVIMSIIAVMVFKGWEMGISESLAIVMMIGLSVDYVVHLAADYTHSIRPTRN
jgi:predicted RND superfamily exporter protein